MENLKFKFKPIGLTSPIETETPAEDRQESLCMEVAECVEELLNSATSFHKLHLKVTGIGSYAQHKALNEIYDSLPDHGDTIAEEFQGAKEELLQYPGKTPRVLNSKEDAIQYTRDLKQMVSELQSKMPYSEIINQLDNVKSSLNSLKYKLIFFS